jgi:hypothetical protein
MGKWQNSIDIDLERINRLEFVDWVHLAQDMDQ